MSVGELLRKARGEMKQSDLAARAGVSQAVVSQIEKGRHRSPQADILTKLEKALDLPHGYLTMDEVVDPSFERYLQSDYAKDADLTKEEVAFLPKINWKQPQDEAPPRAWAKLLEAVREVKKSRPGQNQ